MTSNYILILDLAWEYISIEDIRQISCDILPLLPERICRELEIELETYYRKTEFCYRIKVGGLAWRKPEYKINISQLKEYLITNGKHIRKLQISNFAKENEKSFILLKQVQGDIWYLIKTHCLYINNITTYPLDLQATSLYKKCSTIELSLINSQSVDLPALNCKKLKLWLKDDEFEPPSLLFNQVLASVPCLQSLNISGPDCYWALNDINHLIPVLQVLSKIKTLKHIDWTLHVRFAAIWTSERINYNLTLDSYKLTIEKDYATYLTPYIFQVALFPVKCTTLYLKAYPDDPSLLQIKDYLNQQPWHSLSLDYDYFHSILEFVTCKVEYYELRGYHDINIPQVVLAQASILSYLSFLDIGKDFIIKNATSKFVYLELDYATKDVTNYKIRFDGLDGYKVTTRSCVPIGKDGYKIFILYLKHTANK